MTTIITALIFGTCAVAALLIMRHDHRAERRARQEAIDEATAPWRALYAEREAAHNRARLRDLQAAPRGLVQLLQQRLVRRLPPPAEIAQKFRAVNLHG